MSESWPGEEYEVEKNILRKGNHDDRESCLFCALNPSDNLVKPRGPFLE